MEDYKQFIGKAKKPTIINELKLGKNSLANPEDIAEVSNDYFSNIGPNLASQINASNFNFETYVKHAKSKFTAFQPLTVNHVSQLQKKNHTVDTVDGTTSQKIAA